ncbi:MAG: putative toxin-antitoxin system toxin component, PIN family [Candidatus Micrarchaeota archaeon]
MIKAVADSNILVSFLFWEGKPFQIINLAMEGKIALFSSHELMDELAEALKRDFDVGEASCRNIIGGLEYFTTILKPENRIDLIWKDPDDNRVLECAKAANADYIVSGDRHILELEEFEGIKIRNADRFLREIEGKY